MVKMANLTLHVFYHQNIKQIKTTTKIETPLKKQKERENYNYLENVVKIWIPRFTL